MEKNNNNKKKSQHKRDNDPHERETQQREQTRSRGGHANFSAALPANRRRHAEDAARTGLFIRRRVLPPPSCGGSPSGALQGPPCRSLHTHCLHQPGTPWPPPGGAGGVRESSAPPAVRLLHPDPKILAVAAAATSLMSRSTSQARASAAVTFLICEKMIFSQISVDQITVRLN